MGKLDEILKDITFKPGEQAPTAKEGEPAPEPKVEDKAGSPTPDKVEDVNKVDDQEIDFSKVPEEKILGYLAGKVGKEVRLTAKEFDLLQLFINNRGKVFSREAMLETVWKYDYMGDARTVDVHIRRLREKIERNTSQPEFIFTKWGVGYYFTDKD